MLLVLFVVVDSSRRNPKTRKQVVCALVCSMSPSCGSDQFARHVHRGVGGSPRVMVQHTRVVVGATSYNTAHKLFY